MAKHKEGDTIYIPVRVEKVEVYGGEATYFVSSDIFDGFGEVAESDIKDAEIEPEDEVIILTDYGKELAKELARVAG